MGMLYAIKEQYLTMLFGLDMYRRPQPSSIKVGCVLGAGAVAWKITCYVKLQSSQIYAGNIRRNHGNVSSPYMSSLTLPYM